MHRENQRVHDGQRVPLRAAQGVALALLLTLAACGGGDDSDATPSQGPSTSEPTAAATSDAERPDVAPLRCQTLLTQNAIDDALDIWNRPSGDMDTIGGAGGEVCQETVASDQDVFVRIEPGEPQDFKPGAQLLGVEGERVAGIGDGALWFGGVDAEGGGKRGVLTVAQESSVGGVVFRIVLGRPDLDSAEQLAVAKAVAATALPRFPGVTLGQSTAIEHEPADRSGESFTENLLAREADGDWTRGEGLVATLRYFAGEIDASEVLRHPQVLDGSGTGIVKLAQEYVQTSSNDVQVAEINRLLKLLAMPEPRRSSANARPESAGSSGRFMAAPSTQAETPVPDSGVCYTVWPDYGDPCFMSTAAAPEFAGKYVFWFPVLDPGETEWEGWTFGPSTIRDAIHKTAVQLEGMGGGMPRVSVVLAPFEGHSWVTLRPDGLCEILLNKGAQALRDKDPALLQQAVASTIARCYIDWNFQLPEQWEAPIAWYLSDVVYPRASMETVILKIPETLASEELSTPVDERSLSNMAFFEYVDAALGLQGTMDAVGTFAASGLGSVPSIEGLLHEYAKSLADGFIQDQAGTHVYAPPAERMPLSQGQTISADIAAFGVERIHVVVPAGNYACLEYPDASNLDISASWRAGAPGESGDWTSALPSTIQGEGVFVVTAADPGGSFSIKVTDLDNDPKCDEDEESTHPAIPTPCPFCDPSQYFFKWGSISKYLIDE